MTDLVLFCVVFGPPIVFALVTFYNMENNNEL